MADYEVIVRESDGSYNHKLFEADTISGIITYLIADGYDETDIEKIEMKY